MVKGKLTAIPQVKYGELLYRIAIGDVVTTICKEFNIGYQRYINISNKEKTRIDEIRQRVALEKSNKFIVDSVIKRAEILENITKEDISDAKLHQKTAAIVDLTNMKRLESGQSTENINVISKEMTDQALRDYILNGNKTVTPE